jgi:photosystem II stability/assembly factor-like uncharacterized protein
LNRELQQEVHMRQTGWVLAFLAVVGLAVLAPAAQGGTPTPGNVPVVATVDGAVRSFGASSPHAAWAVDAGRLLLTADGGASWREATPPDVTLTGAAVAFLDPATGWVAELASDAPGAVRVAATTDGGRTWLIHQHTLFAPNDPAGQSRALAMHWLDRDTGWLVVRQATSSNFNQGTLFGTQDGGASWQRLTLPGGEPVYFISATTGWTAGGPHGDTWFRSDDGGRTWQPVMLPYPDAAGRGQRRHYPPHFTADGQHGVVAVTTATATGQRVDWYATHDGGASWAVVDELPGAAMAGARVAQLDAAAWLMATTGQPLRQPAPAAPFFANPALAAPAVALATLAMTTPDDGWATDVRGAYLLRTRDGGRSWQVQLIGAEATAPPTTLTRPGRVNAAGVLIEDRTARLAGPGFDKCELASEEELRRWIAESPYRAVNLYIGGSMRACLNETMDASRLKVLTQQGWTFIPTWVGPQAPCIYDPNNRLEKFALDPTTAFAQGRAEAEMAVQVAADLELAHADGSGTVIYYDLEAYDGQDTACVEASRAFVAGWTQRLQASSSYAGLYALACNPPMTRYADTTPAPDTVWFAAWNRDQFDPAMTVMTGIPAWCLPANAWTQQQRIRQYTGSHDETWGGVTLEIDSNVLDGIVADLGGVAPPAPVTVVLEAPELSPVFNATTACTDGWHRFTNVRGEAAYLAYSQPLGATIPPLNYGVWRPTLPITGTYRVEALISSHGAIAWPCRGEELSPDTSRARYTIYHRDGVTTTEQDQLPLNDAWLGLGSFPFDAGDGGFVYLDAAVADAPKNVSFSAMRFVLEAEGILPARVYLPAVQR